MNYDFKPARRIFVFLATGFVALAVTAGPLDAADTASPKFNIETTPIERDGGTVPSYAPVFKHVAPSVVNIYSTVTVRERQIPHIFDMPFWHGFGSDSDSDSSTPHARTRKEQSLGSGVVVSPDGYILTANHVVEGADEIKVALASGGDEFTAKVVGADPPTDVAVLKIDAHDLPAITMADSDKLEVGDVVLAVGNPFGVGQTLTAGIVSGVGRTSLGVNDYEDFIQTDAAINPGNSGGALVDAKGRLIGINTVIFSESGGYQGVGFAVPVNMARNVMERLIKDGKVTRGYLGVGLQPEISPDLAKEFNLPDATGAMVTTIEPGSPAARARLKDGDVVREVDGKPVVDRQQFRLLISETEPGTKVNLKFIRDGKDQTVGVTLAELPQDYVATAETRRVRPAADTKPAKSDALDGVEVGDIDNRARRQLEIPREIRGALVTKVDGDSSAADAGLREGDIILEINHTSVDDADTAVSLSDKLKASRVLVRVWRAGSAFYMVVNNGAK